MKQNCCLQHEHWREGHREVFGTIRLQVHQDSLWPTECHLNLKAVYTKALEGDPHKMVKHYLTRLEGQRTENMMHFHGYAVQC